MAAPQLAPVRGVLLDIEGTTASISFVHDVMFPYAAERLEQFLATEWEKSEVQQACQQIARDAGFESLDQWHSATGSSPQQLVIDQVRRWMAEDAKLTGLKALQGLIWQSGFHSGQLQAHVYPDVLPAIDRWRQAGIDVRIYSSGSIAAQKLFFGHIEGVGNCLDRFSGHYDTTIGGKKESTSYRRIAADWGLPAEEILFISDVADELTAAHDAGMQVLASERPGNQPLPPDLPFPRIQSFDEAPLP
ncbi:MAG: enolase-phosphatase E1 [Pirellulaceae bacterium]|nr:MAG: enolase-phosphatase E1 [Pirellulaceae bacterium]